MGLEIKMGYNDHRKVEDFVATRPAALTAIHVDAKWVGRHSGAVDAAKRVGVDVVVEPLTEFLFSDGSPPPVSYAPARPFTVSRLVADDVARRALVDQVVATQDGVGTVVVPPFCCIDSPRSMQLNELFVSETVAAYGVDRRIRPIALVEKSFLAERPTRAQMIAARYLDAGVTELELRITPSDPERASLVTLEAIMVAVTAMSTAGLTVTMSHQGVFGRLGVALGVAEGYVLGVGMRETIRHSDQVARQAKAGGGGGFAPQAGVYLAPLGMTIPRARVESMLTNARLRTRLACRLGPCSTDILGPVSDPRGHYLHARAHELSELLAQPVRWRANAEHGRCREALDLREMINERFCASGDGLLPTRGVRAVLDYLDMPRQQRSAAG